MLDVLQFHCLNIDHIPSNYFVFLVVTFFFSFGSKDSLGYFYACSAIFTEKNSSGILLFLCTQLLYYICTRYG